MHCRIPGKILGDELWSPHRWVLICARMMIAAIMASQSQGLGDFDQKESGYEYGLCLVRHDFDAETLNNGIALVFIDVPVMWVTLVRMNRLVSIPVKDQSFYDPVVLPMKSETSIPTSSMRPWWRRFLTKTTERLEVVRQSSKIRFCTGSEIDVYCRVGGGDRWSNTTSVRKHTNKDVQLRISSYSSTECSLRRWGRRLCNARVPGWLYMFVCSFSKWIASNIRMYSKSKK